MSGAETFRASADAYDRLVGRYSAAVGRRADRIRRRRARDARPRRRLWARARLTTALASRLGTANVAAADPSEPFVDACRARLPGVEVVVAGAEALPFADGAFDAALSQLVVNFMRDPEAGCARWRASRARAASSPPALGLRGGDDAPARLLGRGARGRPAGGAAATRASMRWSAEGDLAKFWSAAGLRECAPGRSW